MGISHRINGVISPVVEVSNAIDENVEQLVAQVEHRNKRVKTRFLSFKFNDASKPEAQIEEDVCGAELPGHELTSGRLVIVEGEGRGRSLDLKIGYNRIGRADGQEVQLAFGDDSVSRDSHATIVHCGNGREPVIRDGISANPVALNGRILRGDGFLKSGDLIRIGATTLQFME